MWIFHHLHKMTVVGFYFFFLIFMHCIIFLFVTRAQFYGWVNPAGVFRMFYCSFQKSVVLCWMSAWMKITLKERGILALNQSPESFITILETAGLCAKEHMPCHFLWFYQFVILIPQYPVSQKTILKTQISCTKSSVMCSNSLGSSWYHGVGESQTQGSIPNLTLPLKDQSSSCSKFHSFFHQTF